MASETNVAAYKKKVIIIIIIIIKKYSDSCRPAWLEMDRKVCPTTTTS